MTPLRQFDLVALQLGPVGTQVVPKTRPRLQGHDQGVLERHPRAASPPEADALKVHDVLVVAQEPQLASLSVFGVI